MSRAFEDVIRATALHELELGIIERHRSSEELGTNQGEKDIKNFLD